MLESWSSTASHNAHQRPIGPYAIDPFHNCSKNSLYGRMRIPLSNSCGYCSLHTMMYFEIRPSSISALSPFWSFEDMFEVDLTSTATSPFIMKSTSWPESVCQ